MICRMVENMTHIGSTNLDRLFSIYECHNEFGVQARVFNWMRDRIHTLICEKGSIIFTLIFIVE